MLVASAPGLPAAGLSGDLRDRSRSLNEDVDPTFRDLASALDQAERRCAVLEEELEKRDVETVDLRRQYDSLEAAHDELQQELSHTEQQLAQLGTRSRTVAHAAALKQDLEEAMEERERLTQTVEALRSQLSEQQLKNEENDTGAESAAELQHLKEHVHDLQTENKILREEVKLARSSQAEPAFLQADHELADERLLKMELEQELNMFRDGYQRLEQEIADVKLQKLEMQQRLEQYQSQEDAVEAAISEQERRFKLLQRQLQEIDRERCCEIDELHQQLLKSQQRCSQLEMLLKDSENKRQQVLAMQSSMELELQRTAAELLEVERELNNKSEPTSPSTINNNNARTLSSSSTPELERLQEENQTMAMELIENKLKLAEMHETITKLQRDLAHKETLAKQNGTGKKGWFG